MVVVVLGMSADAIEDDEWWLRDSATAVEVDGSGTAKRKRVKTEEAAVDMKKKRRRRHKADDLVEVLFSTLHTAKIQREELSKSLQSATDKELTFKRSHFVEYVAEDGDAPDVSQYARAVCPEWSQLTCGFHTRGSPILLLLTAAATRAVILRRDLSEFSGGCTIGKLFGRHMKVEEQAAFLASHCTPIAVATPARLLQLIQRGELSLSSLRLVLVDWYWRDKKLRKFSDIPEVWKDFVSLYLYHFQELVRTKQIKLTLY